MSDANLFSSENGSACNHGWDIRLSVHPGLFQKRELDLPRIRMLLNKNMFQLKR